MRAYAYHCHHDPSGDQPIPEVDVWIDEEGTTYMEFTEGVGNSVSVVMRPEQFAAFTALVNKPRRPLEIPEPEADVLPTEPAATATNAEGL